MEGKRNRQIKFPCFSQIINWNCQIIAWCGPVFGRRLFLAAGSVNFKEISPFRKFSMRKLFPNQANKTSLLGIYLSFEIHDPFEASRPLSLNPRLANAFWISHQLSWQRINQPVKISIPSFALPHSIQIHIWKTAPLSGFHLLNDTIQHYEDL